MNNLHVSLPNNAYDIHISRGLLKQAAGLLPAAVLKGKVAVLTDTTLDALYGEKLSQSLRSAGAAVQVIRLEPGEEHKNLTTLAAVYNSLAAFGLSRSDTLIAFGGGVVGDLGGFAAATYLRGIRYIQMPTTLLAQVDSSVGGKTAVNLAGGKNQVGSFYQPAAVYIDPDLLDSLSPRCVGDGLGEVIKYGAICNDRIFSFLERQSPATIGRYWEEIITACCREKARIVAADVHDQGKRMLLNFGHTFGHAVERACGYGTYLHGEAVSIGMVRITAGTERQGLTEKGTTARLIKLLERYRLPTEISLPDERLMPFLRKDKKRRGDTMTLAIIPAIGRGKLISVACEAMPDYLGREGLR